MSTIKPTLNSADITFLKKVFATKADLKKFSTKDGLSRNITNVMRYIDQKTNILASKSEFYEVKSNLEEVKTKINHLPTKDEFYTQMGKVMAELQAIRTNQTVQTSQTANHSNRLEVIETKLAIIPN